MQFTKMHGSGNDYIYLDCFRHEVPEDVVQQAPMLSDRHTGIGGDGIILIRPSQVADARMQMFNADGSQAEMCGNGIRCVGKYVYDHGLCRNNPLKIETLAGVLTLDLETTGGVVQRVRVDMGEPILEPDRIPTTLPGNPVVNAELQVDGRRLQVTCVSMGNPHCVTFVDEASDELVLGLGPKIECDARFPARVNVEFVEVHSPTELRQRTWERGSGETLACGTGASAVCVAGVLTGRAQRHVEVSLLGGPLELEWSEANNHIYMTGPAVEVYSGVWRGSSSDLRSATV